MYSGFLKRFYKDFIEFLNFKLKLNVRRFYIIDYNFNMYTFG